MTLDLFGIAAALSAALFWAIATSFYRQMAVFWSPAGLAAVKSSISALLFLVWFLITGVDFWAHEFQTLIWLFVSGVIGIALGDTAIFYALYRMNERETLIVAETAAPILVVVFAFIILGESLSITQLLGIALIVIGVDSVINVRHRSQFDAIGVSFALLAAVCQAFGMIVSRNFLTQTEITAEETAFWRLAGAAVVLPIWLLVRREAFRPAMALTPKAAARLAVAILLGTFLGVLLLQISVQRLPAGLAQALIATSIVFATVIGVVRGDRVTSTQWLGILLAVLGVALIVL